MTQETPNQATIDTFNLASLNPISIQMQPEGLLASSLDRLCHCDQSWLGRIYELLVVFMNALGLVLCSWPEFVQMYQYFALDDIK